MLLVLALLSRLLFMADYPEEWDSIGFILAMEEYDLRKFQPHFPGYPLYIFFSRVFYWLLGDPVKSTIIPGAICGGLTTLLIYGLARNFSSKGGALLTAGLYILAPLPWLEAEKAFSDSFGLFFLMLGAFCFSKGLGEPRPLRTPTRITDTIYWGSVFMGLSLGVRLSYFPFLFTWLLWVFFLWRKICQTTPFTPHTNPFAAQKGEGDNVIPIQFIQPIRKWVGFIKKPSFIRLKKGGDRRFNLVLDAIHGMTLGIGIWLVPFIAVTGFGELMAMAREFVGGHFNTWGGTVFTVKDPIFRAKMFLWDIFAQGLGFFWPDPDSSYLRIIPTSIIGIALFMAIKRRRIRWNENTQFFLLYLIPYTLWAFLGQNIVEKPRHVLPLIPIGLIFISLGFEPLKRSWGIAIVLLLSLACISIPLVIAHKKAPPPQMQLARYVLENYPKDSTIFYGLATRRFIYYIHGGVETREKGSLEEVLKDLKSQSSIVNRQSSIDSPSTVVLTSEIKGVEKIGPPLKRFKRNRYIHNPFHEIALYRLTMPPL